MRPLTASLFLPAAGVKVDCGPHAAFTGSKKLQLNTQVKVKGVEGGGQVWAGTESIYRLFLTTVFEFQILKI